jgi:SAM-dependent methyltransferase
LNAHLASGIDVKQKFFSRLWGWGPLGIIKRAIEYLQGHINNSSGLQGLLRFADRHLCNIQRYLEGSFDRKYGTSTSGIIQLNDLTINKTDINESNYYAPASEKIFKQIMQHLSVDFSKFDFLDFGSGKGKVLLLASEYGFKKITGVEFAQELHQVAIENINKYNRLKQKPGNIQSVCMDAVEFPIPNEPVVIIFFSPFRGKVLQQVLENMSTSFYRNPREFVLVFIGSNPETLKLLNATKFLWREIEVSPDWSQFTRFRAFLSNCQE